MLRFVMRTTITVLTYLSGGYGGVLHLIIGDRYDVTNEKLSG